MSRVINSLTGFTTDTGSNLTGATFEADAIWYSGEPLIDGTWRIIQVGDDITFQLRESGTYNTKYIQGAKSWKDINLGAAQLAKPASSAPDLDEFKDSTGTDTGVTTFAFAVGEKVSGSFELQHDYVEGTDINFHVHWQGIAAPTGTDKVKWQIIYTVAQDNTVLSPATTIVKETDYDTQYEFVFSAFPAITGTTFKIGNQVLFQLSRIAASATEYAGDGLIATVGIHYEVNSLGSRLIGAK